MKEIIDAIYENGLIRPLRKLSLAEGRRIRVTLDESDDALPLEDERQDTFSVKLESLAGSLKDSPRFNTDPLLIQKKLRDEWT